MNNVTDQYMFAIKLPIPTPPPPPFDCNTAERCNTACTLDTGAIGRCRCFGSVKRCAALPQNQQRPIDTINSNCACYGGSG